MFLVPTRYIFGGHLSFFIDLLLEKLERTKTNIVCHKGDTSERRKTRALLGKVSIY